MRRVPTLLKAFAFGLGAIVLVGGVLYVFFGLQIVMDGGGTPRLRFLAPRDEQAARIAQHREAQRAGAVAPAAPVTEALRSEAVDDGGQPVAGAAPATQVPDMPVSPLSWTSYRGPTRDGSYREAPVLTEWPRAGLTPVWKQPIGGGYASFVAARGRAFTIEQRGQDEVVAAYDIRTGRELWVNAWSTEFRESMGGDGPRATPTWADGVVYALGAMGEFRALEEVTGRTLWRTNILTDSGARNLDWGMAAAPLIVDETVVVLPGGPHGQSVVAYDRANGARVWSAQDDMQAYASPMLVMLSGRRQLLVLSATRLMGLTADGGQLLWEYPFATYNGINAAQPLLLGGDRVFVSASYGAGAAVIEVSQVAESFAVQEVWRNNRMKNRFSSSVLRDGVIYGLDEGILAAVDARTGDLKWKGGRYGYGQLVLVGESLVVLTEDGDLALVRAQPARHQEVVRFPVLAGKTWNGPALDGGYLLVRNLAEMAAFDLRTEEQ